MTFTKERLLKIKTWRETYGPDSNVVLPAEEAEALAQVALSALESRADAEPVGYADPQAFDNFKSVGGKNAACTKEWMWRDSREGLIPLFTYPPAPVVVQCPFPCGWDNLNKLAIQNAAFVARGLVEDELVTEAHRQAVFANNDRLLKVIAACRAAMLAAAPDFRGIPDSSTNGWIPYSQQKPDQGTYISAVSRHGEYVSGLVDGDWLDLHDGTSFGVGEIYLWMLLPELPAAPQQEAE